MNARAYRSARSDVLLGIFVVAILTPALAGADVVDFDSGRWALDNASISDYLGRQSLRGTAQLTDVEFENGVIEVDIAIDDVRTRSYPGVIFRMRPEGNGERFYIRPHRAPIYPDALQYTPVMGGVAGWQLYSGEGFTAPAVIPAKQWLRVKIEIAGSQARVYLGDAEKPALVIPQLKHGASKGSIGVMGPPDGPSYFSNFRYRLDDSLEFDQPPEEEATRGVITDWEVSKAFNANELDLDAYPSFFTIFGADWQKVQSEPSGLVDVSRYVPRTPGRADTIFARTILSATKRRTIKLSFGYSDDVSLFLNGKALFSGKSGYRSRDPSFVGVVGFNDTVHLPLEKGNNEIFLILTERFGGWGFMCKTQPKPRPPSEKEDVALKAWETDAAFKIPESVLYDAQRDVLYVTSYDELDFSRKEMGFVSRLSPDGNIRDLEWITGLDRPCGMAIHGDRLYVVEALRHNLVEIDIQRGAIVNRYSFPNAEFLNDVAIDESGALYVSDTSRHPQSQDIHRLLNGKGEVWEASCDIHRSNGLFIDGNRLLVGNSGDGLLKSIDLKGKRVTTIASLGGGVIDGIRIDNHGNYLVSHWRGKIYRITQDGEATEILDLEGTGLNTADFEFVKDKNLLVIPTFMGNKVVAYTLVQDS